MTRAFFLEVHDALIGFLPPDRRDFGHTVTSRNLKVWFGEDRREHYEVQLVPATAQRAAGRRAHGAALEIGFHAEHPDATKNEDVLARIRRREKTVRRAVGDGVALGAFIGRPSPWRRASELWHDGDLTAPEAAVEAAEHLARYIDAIEPVRVRRGETGR